MTKALIRACVIALLAVSTWALAVPTSAVAAAEYLVYRTEAETFRLSKATVASDTKASNKKSVQIQRGGAVWRWSTMPAGSRFEVRARSVTCGTAPRMVFKLGTAVVKRISVSAVDWTNYSVAVSQPAGTHIPSLWFKDDKIATSGCTRSLSVDRLSLWSPIAANQGIAGSVCQASDHGIAASAAPAGYSTTSAGIGPGYYEAAPPTDRGSSSMPRGLMVLIHGGGWFITGPGAVATMRGSADLWRAEGWSVLNITSTKACGGWVEDVLWFYDAARASSPDLPICINGHSAGGHLALLVAAQRPDVHCAISFGGPTDLRGLSTQMAYNTATGGGQNIGPNSLYQMAVAAFGTSRLEENSPIHRTSDIHASVVAGSAERDPLIPQQQISGLVSALDVAHPEVRHDGMLLPHGTTGWVHAPVTLAAANSIWGLGVETANKDTALITD